MYLWQWNGCHHIAHLFAHWTFSFPFACSFVENWWSICVCGLGFGSSVVVVVGSLGKMCMNMMRTYLAIWKRLVLASTHFRFYFIISRSEMFVRIPLRVNVGKNWYTLYGLQRHISGWTRFFSSFGIRCSIYVRRAQASPEVKKHFQFEMKAFKK